MPLAGRADPFAAFRFVVEIEGVVIGGFHEVRGLDAEIEVVTYREGGLNAYAHQFAGAVAYPSRLVLTRGLTDALWTWYQDVASGRIERKNGSIVLLSDARDEMWRWNFADAYPVRWTGPSLRAAESAVAIETLELVHHGISRG
jgi:phage tail-like protein